MAPAVVSLATLIGGRTALPIEPEVDVEAVVELGYRIGVRREARIGREVSAGHADRKVLGADMAGGTHHESHYPHEKAAA